MPTINGRLETGAHEAPGPNGELCITETAAIAAGYEPRAVHSAMDCPSCFSRVIACYAIELNERLRDDARNEVLKPFICRLAGTADARRIEQQRFEFIFLESVRSFGSKFFLLTTGRVDLAGACEGIQSFTEVAELMKQIECAATEVEKTRPTGARRAWDMAEIIAEACEPHTKHSFAMAAATWLAVTLINGLGGTDLFPIVAGILDRAIRLGRHEEIDIGLAIERLEAARGQLVAA
jgi:hypothetical protein